MFMRVCVLGGGSWGTTIASLAARQTAVTLWCRSEQVAADINTRRVNPRYLEGYELAPGLEASTEMAAAVAPAELVLVAVPSGSFRVTLSAAAQFLKPGVAVVSLTKGLEADSGLRMSQVAAQVLGSHPVGALTGPNLAKEILAGSPAASVVAMADNAADRAGAIQDLLSGETFRVYTNQDLIGCELGGALKNVIALASGIADGLGVGDSGRAALITRGLGEMTRLGAALGGDPATLAGLAGMGDLIATCMSPQSRNRYFGEQLGKGRTVAEVSADMTQVAEGVSTAAVAARLAEAAEVSTPIMAAVLSVINGERLATEAYRRLLGRTPTIETGEPR